jgi:hypothetical protein
MLGNLNPMSRPGHIGRVSAGGSPVGGAPSGPMLFVQQLPFSVSVSMQPGWSGSQSVPSSSSHQKSTPFASRVPCHEVRSGARRLAGRIPMQLSKKALLFDVSVPFAGSGSLRKLAGTQCSIVPRRQLSKM